MTRWEDDEPGYADGRRDLPRLMRRSRPRRVLVALIACVVASGFLAWRILHPKKREARLALRVVESDFDLTKDVRPVKDYTDYIWGVFLSTPRLTKIIQKYHLYPDKLARDPILAVEAMRDDLDVKVWRNYFLEEHYADDEEARSVRFSISWKARDAQTALDVVRDLASIVVSAQGDERRQVFEAGQKNVEEAAQEAFRRLEAVTQAESVRRAKLATADEVTKARLMVELIDLEDEEKDQKLRLASLTDEKSRVELAAGFERERSGLVFEMVDPGYVEPLRSGPRQLAASVVLVWVATAFFASMVFGAFETKIRQPGDVKHLGVQLLGALPPFPGDDTGSLADRLRAEDRLRWEQR